MSAMQPATVQPTASEAVVEKPSAAADEPVATVKVGVVEGAAEDFLSVRLGARRLLARRATSCLVDPVVGDRVLCAEEEGGGFVLAILERATDAPTVIATTGDLELAPRGKLTVTAPTGVHVATAREMTLTSTSLEVVTEQASVVWKALQVAGRTLRAEVARLEVVSEESTSITGRLMQRAKRAFRVVDQVETLRAGQVDVLAETNLRMHGQTALVTSDDLVKVDGKQIQLG
jgi:hypothetical protein